MFCPKCGMENSSFSKYCSNCNISLSDSLGKEEENIRGISNSVLKLFIGSRQQEYYLSKWSKLEQSQRTTSWNWAAFFFSIFWLAYRKIYGVAIILTIAFAFVVGAFSPIVSVIIGIIIAIGGGVFGNSLYLKHVEKGFAIVKAASAEENAEVSSIKGRGGVSISNAILTILVFLILAYIFNSAI